MTLRLLAFLPLVTLVLFAHSNDESEAVATAQKLFDGMAARDGGIIRATLLPDARFYSLRADATVTSTSAEDFISHIAAVNGTLLERFTRKPTVLIQGRIAQVWAEYEFLRNGTFGHCGIDSFSLFKTADGWRIASITYTSETSSCQGH
jgi:hypothetical protein